MQLTSLTLQNFRKWEHLNLHFPKKKVICFTGPNTIGKTNILEAIYMLSLLKSFRTNEIHNLLMWGSNHFSVQGTYIDREEQNNLAVNMVFRPKKARKYLVNGIEESLSDYVGTINVVFFSPDDINLLLLSPASRRKYLDVLLSQTDKHYLRAYVTYQKVLKQRNSLLKAISAGFSTTEELEYWDGELARHATLIHTRRKALIDFFNERIDTKYQEISKHHEHIFTIDYLPSAKLEEISEEHYLTLYTTTQHKDLILESTHSGPHRDDFSFLLGEKSIDDFASRGDTRSMILALKLAEIEYIQTVRGNVPVLLLDDVFSELDQDRQEHLLCSLPENIQTFITTTTQDIGVLSKRTKDIEFIDVEHIST